MDYCAAETYVVRLTEYLLRQVRISNCHKKLNLNLFWIWMKFTLISGSLLRSLIFIHSWLSCDEINYQIFGKTLLIYWQPAWWDEYVYGWMYLKLFMNVCTFTMSCISIFLQNNFKKEYLLVLCVSRLLLCRLEKWQWHLVSLIQLFFNLRLLCYFVVNRACIFLW